MMKSYAKFSMEKKPLTRSLERSDADLNMNRALEAILSTSPYNDEEELKEQLQELAGRKKSGTPAGQKKSGKHAGQTKSGTKIVLFRLKW